MNAWEIQSCRGCLLQDNVSAMYDLAVPNIKRIFSECTDTVFDVDNESGNVPQFLCNMCYRICELWLGFRERCQENQKKIKRVSKTKKKNAPGISNDRKEKTQKVEPVSVYSLDDAEPYWEDREDGEENATSDTALSDTYFPPPKKRTKSHHRKSGNPLEVKGKATENLTFGPGPNERGVWLHYLRAEDKCNVKCNYCDKVMYTTNGSTSLLWKHLKHHGVTRGQELESINESKNLHNIDDDEEDQVYEDISGLIEETAS